ncbi:DUF3644 domain-containing protein [Pseudomonas spirodelae]|uniref:DUF3644 domain-containing protein n=1 Tax=Pseudomonas spirodelae TaxID=3101751 RepID=A0ABU5PD39_9PSED|nr:DUF3644 domain-containing protein [Pseudomonas sp. T5W1]MEA1607425.1 DUF3644 domain-containing protein [Pseudomonas sp. T5W1]
MALQAKRVRAVGSIASELIKKSREAALASVQIFNNPALTFKSEIFIVLMMISWTYLLHAHYRKSKVEYRYFKMTGSRKSFHKTAKGAIKHWELERCLNDENSPVDASAAKNLRFLIGLRHEIEHQMTSRIDQFLSARFQACCLNYNDLIKRLFGDEFGIDKHLSFSLQFSSLNKGQVEMLSQAEGLPENIRAYITAFDLELTAEEFNDPRFSYRVFFVPKTANHKGQADQVIEFIKPGSEMAEGMNTKYIQIKETERPKYLPTKIVELVKAAGFARFNMVDHTRIWKDSNAKSQGRGYGVLVANTWYWYGTWLEKVIGECEAQGQKFR